MKSRISKVIALAALMFAASLCANSSEKVSSINSANVYKLDAAIDSHGELIVLFPEAGGKSAQYKGEDAFEKLKAIARFACKGAPDSISISAGFLTLSWSREQICND